MEILNEATQGKSPTFLKTYGKTVFYGLLWAGTIAIAYEMGGKASPGAAAGANGSLVSPDQSGGGGGVVGGGKKSVVGRAEGGVGAEEEESGRLTVEGDTLASLNPQEEFESLLKQPGSPERNRALRKLFAQWAELDGPGALAKSQSISEPLLRHEVRESALRHWALADPEAAWQFAKKDNGLTLPDGRFDTILRGIGRGDIQTALKFFETHQEGDLIGSIGEAAGAFDNLYQRGGHSVLLPWVEGLKAGKMKDAAANRVVDQWARYDPEGAKAWLEANVPAGSANIVPARIELAESWARVDPKKALDWTNSLPATEQQREYFDRIFKRWLDYDRDAAAAHLADQPPSPNLDRSIERYAYEVAGRNPSSTMPWAESISDEKRRWRAIERVAEVWRKKDPNGLANYVLSGQFTPEQQQILLKREDKKP